jgi:hypothetical protein
MTTQQHPNYQKWVEHHSMSKEELRKEWIAKANEFVSAALELSIIWEHLDTADNGDTSVDYPFSESFDAEASAFSYWVQDIEKKWGK